jgi:hypothetical protein
MTTKAVQLVREGEYAAEVMVDLHQDGGDWSPTVDLEDIRKLDRVRVALRTGNLRAAAKDAKLFKLVPQEEAHYPATGFAEDPQDPFKS